MNYSLLSFYYNSHVYSFYITQHNNSNCGKVREAYNITSNMAVCFNTSRNNKIDNLILMMSKLNARIDKPSTKYKFQTYQKKKRVPTKQKYDTNHYWIRNRSFSRDRTSYRDKSRARNVKSYRQNYRDRSQHYYRDDYRGEHYRETQNYKDSYISRHRDYYNITYKVTYSNSYGNTYKDTQR